MITFGLYCRTLFWYDSGRACNPIVRIGGCIAAWIATYGKFVEKVLVPSCGCSWQTVESLYGRSFRGLESGPAAGGIPATEFTENQAVVHRKVGLAGLSVSGGMSDSSRVHPRTNAEIVSID